MPVALTCSLQAVRLLWVHAIRSTWCTGYFSLNVPSGLALYWFTNNILSTGQQAWLKSAYADTGTAAVPSASDAAEEERLERVKQLTGGILGRSGWVFEWERSTEPVNDS